MKTIEEFRQYYETELRPVLDGFEGRRKRICRTFLWIVFGSLGVVGPLALAAGAGDAPLGIIPVGLIAAVIIIAVSWWVLTKNYVPEFKRRVIGAIVRFCDPSLAYSPEQHISESQFRGSRIFTTSPDRFSGEDCVAGKIGATAIAFSEIHAEYKTTSLFHGRQRTQWHTIFKGLFIIADFNKEFRTTTVVVPDVAERALGRLCQFFQKMNIVRPGQLIKLEAPEFEKLFAVYGEDQIEARYVLSTSLMSRIMDYRKKTGKEISLSFVSSNVHVAIPTAKNMFEPRIFKTVLDFGIAREYLEDLQLALGVVDDLNLNTRIWSKE